jgi:hypothetical protein
VPCTFACLIANKQILVTMTALFLQAPRAVDAAYALPGLGMESLPLTEEDQGSIAQMYDMLAADGGDASAYGQGQLPLNGLGSAPMQVLPRLA